MVDLINAKGNGSAFADIYGNVHMLGEYKEERETAPKFTRFMWKSTEYSGSNKDMRLSQAMMGYLEKFDVSVYNGIRATEIDCFYADVVISETLRFLQKHWEGK